MTVCVITAISKSTLYVAKQPLSFLYQTAEQPPEYAVALCPHLLGWHPGKALAASYSQSLIPQGSAQTVRPQPSSSANDQGTEAGQTQK